MGKENPARKYSRVSLGTGVPTAQSNPDSVGTLVVPLPVKGAAMGIEGVSIAAQRRAWMAAWRFDGFRGEEVLE